MSDKLSDITGKMRKKFGDDSISNFDTVRPVESISSGSILLDRATGVGGFPRGRLVEIFGVESSGKSTLAMSAGVNCQKIGLPVLYLDFEHSFDPTYAEVIGLSLSPDLFIHSMPNTMEQGLGLVGEFVEAGVVGMVIVDSVAAMVTTSEAEAEIGKVFIAPQAKALGQILRILVPKIDSSKTSVLFVNHVHEMIGTKVPIKTTPGGKALKFYAGLRVELQPAGTEKGKVVDYVTGEIEEGIAFSKIRIRVIKNKVARPFLSGWTYLTPGKGIDDRLTVLEVAEARGLVIRKGAWYTFPDLKDSIQGQAAVLTYFDDHDEEYQKLKLDVIEKLKE